MPTANGERPDGYQLPPGVVLPQHMQLHDELALRQALQQWRLASSEQQLDLLVSLLLSNLTVRAFLASAKLSLAGRLAEASKQQQQGWQHNAASFRLSLQLLTAEQLERRMATALVERAELNAAKAALVRKAAEGQEASNDTV